MKNNLITVDIESVESLEQYLMQMGMLAISINTLGKLQTIATNKGIFNDDEIEKAKTISWRASLLMNDINDQVAMTSERSGVEWPKLLSRIVKTLPSKKVEIKKPRGKKK